MIWGTREPRSVAVSLEKQNDITYLGIDELRSVDLSELLKLPGIDNPENFGPDFTFVGAGDAYGRWRESADYETWMKEARDACKEAGS